MENNNLPTNFKDDVLSDSMGGLRRYQTIQNDDNTVSFQDVTTYTQVGDDFGADEVNEINRSINKIQSRKDFVGTQAELESAIEAGETYEGMTAYVEDETEEDPDAGGVGNIEDYVVTFSEAAERENIASGETFKTILGKIMKWFSDTKSASFCSVANNLTTEEEGSLLDARQGKVLSERYDNVADALNATNFNFKMKKYVDTECSSHIEVLQKHWNEAFADAGTAGAYRIVFTNFGSSNVVWTCYSYHNKLYGYAANFSHIASPYYYTINNGTWGGPYNLVRDSDLYEKCMTLSAGSSIPANANLDTYKTLGNYCCDTSAVAATLSNCPTGIAFKMVVDYATGYGYTRQILIPYKSNAIYMRSADDNGNYPSKWERFVTYSDMISSFTVENPTGAYSEASLKSQIHQRMITLANEAREQVGYYRNLHIPWNCTWVGFTNISGEVTFFINDAGNNIYNYITTLFLYNQAFLCYGITSKSEMSYFNKLL